MELSRNTKLQNGEITIIKKLGSGGFGITYLAKHVRYGKIALKELFLAIPNRFCTRDKATVQPAAKLTQAEFEKFKKDFIKEAFTLLRLRDIPHIVNVHDYFEENNTVYFFMEYLEGQPLQKLVERQGKLSVETALGYIQELGTALINVHKRGILHRDIKPENIIITNQNEAVLIDFGIARDFIGKKTGVLTIMGTRLYAPPEQFVNDYRLKEYTDVFALAGTLYFCLTGRPPQTKDDIDIRGFKTPNYYNKSIPKQVDDAVVKALKRNPTKRTQNIEAFFKHLSLVKAKQEEIPTIIGEVVPEIIVPKKIPIFDFCEMVYVKGGSFRMGDEHGDLWDACRPVHQVTLDSFYIGKYPITQKQWKDIMGSNPSYFKGNENRPVECVNWHDIQAFIKKLHAKT